MRKPSSRSLSAAPPSKVGLKRGPWTAQEDELLVNCIKRHGEGRWRTLPNRAGLLRCGKSCRLRWVNYLRPSIKRGPIDPDEEDLILRLHRLLGNRWALIAGRIPGRTDNEIKNYWNSHLSKKLMSQGIDPRTHKPLNPNSNSNPNPNSSGVNGSSTMVKLPPIPYPKLNPNRNPISLKTIDSTIPNLPLVPNPVHNPNPISSPNFSKTIDSTKPILPPIPYPKPKSSETFDSTIPNLPANIPDPNPNFSGLEQHENTKVINMDGDQNPMIDTSNEGLLDCDILMMGLQSNCEIGDCSNGEDDMELCNDDIFSSFLSSLINEDVLENQLPNLIAPSTSMAALGEEQQDG